jgi:prepilin-type N-terminal cleavage/methylation domain-containing protein
MAERIREDSGYSLVEVMVAIVIMTIAILPMVSMFDMGLHSTTEGSDYDKARMLANLKLEQAKNLPFDSGDDAIQDVKDNFPEPAGTETIYDGSGYYESDPETEPGFPNPPFTYVIEKQYMMQPCLDPDTGELDLDCPSWDFSTSNAPTNLIRIKVTVRWDDNEYTTYGLVTG